MYFSCFFFVILSTGVCSDVSVCVWGSFFGGVLVLIGDFSAYCASASCIVFSCGVNCGSGAGEGVGVV